MLFCFYKSTEYKGTKLAGKTI